MFDVYKKKVTINGTEYELRPLPGKYVAKVYALLTKMDLKETAGSSDQERAEDFLKKMSEEDLRNIHEISFETFKRSYPNEDHVVLEEFVSQNLMSVFPAVIEVNLNNRPGK